MSAGGVLVIALESVKKTRLMVRMHGHKTAEAMRRKSLSLAPANTRFVDGEHC